jgi:A/G-specific adenine glycosylase
LPAASRPRPGPRIPDARRIAFGRHLRAWYRRHARDLPWRHTRDAYHILVSELMLQQTQVSRVLTKYEVFLETVAAASSAHVSEAWSGLGYYARARHLHELARQLALRVSPGVSPAQAPSKSDTTIHSAARLPADLAALRALPGIGRYTAGAIASFAYERAAPLVDTNVARVLTRVFAPGQDPRTAAGRRTAWAIAEHTLPRAGPIAYTHNQALMELGALICTARTAHCDRCPVRSVCSSAVKRDRSKKGTRDRSQRSAP